MHKNVSTIIITSVCFLAIIIVTISYLFKEGIISTDNLLYNYNYDNSQNENNNEASESSLGYPIRRVLLKEGAECIVQYSDERYKIDEYSDIYVKFNSFKVSKNMGNFDLCDDWDEIKDEKGTITNNYSYVICNVTIINKGKLSITTAINYLHLWFGIDNGYTEIRSYNSGKSDTFLKDYYYVTFKPGEEYNYNIAFIVEDNLIHKYKSNLLLLAGFLESFDTTLPVIDKQ